MTDRRPIASRGSGWARALTKWLAARDISPNQISIASMAAAGLAGLCFYFGAMAGGFGGALLLLAAALFCQIRLICNLMDGLVAIEAQKGTPDGAFWNEAPDRVSDVLIFVGLGYGLGTGRAWLGCGCFGGFHSLCARVGSQYHRRERFLRTDGQAASDGVGHRRGGDGSDCARIGGSAVGALGCGAGHRGDGGAA